MPTTISHLLFARFAFDEGLDAQVGAVGRDGDRSAFAGPPDAGAGRSQSRERLGMRMAEWAGLGDRDYRVSRVYFLQKTECRGGLRTVMRDFQDIGAQIAFRFNKPRFGFFLDVAGQQETARAERDSQYH